MNHTRFTSILLLTTVLLSSSSSHGQDTKSGAIDGKNTATLKSQDACKSAAIHYERKDISNREIAKIFEEVAQSGDVRGVMWLARLRYKGRCSLPKQPEQAQDTAKKVIGDIMKLAEKGDSEAQFLLGSAYQEGLGVAQNSKEAVKWYRKAANSGHITAANNLGYILSWGHGTDPDIDKARSLFALAAKQGSRIAALNLRNLQDDNRDDTKRLASLRKVSLVKALGMQKVPGITFLAKQGLISNPKDYEESYYRGNKQYHFKADGIVLNFDSHNRITNVEGHASGSRDSKPFRGDIPFGLTWDDSSTSAMEKLGAPDDSGSVSYDNAYGMAYRIENVFFAVMFSYLPGRKLKLWRVYEKWAVKYPDQQDKSKAPSKDVNNLDL